MEVSVSISIIVAWIVESRYVTISRFVNAQVLISLATPRQSKTYMLELSVKKAMYSASQDYRHVGTAVHVL